MANCHSVLQKFIFSHNMKRVWQGVGIHWRMLSTHSVEYKGKPHRELGPSGHLEQNKDDRNVDQGVADI